MPAPGSDPSTAEQPRPSTSLAPIAPLDLPMVPFVLAGMACWAAAGLTLLAFRAALVEHARERWLAVCLVGLLIGLANLPFMIRRDARRRGRRSSP